MYVVHVNNNKSAEHTVSYSIIYTKMQPNLRHAFLLLGRKLLRNMVANRGRYTAERLRPIHCNANLIKNQLRVWLSSYSLSSSC